jgi:2-(3-amino-3-carboxypropyl)histidine synthase
VNKPVIIVDPFTRQIKKKELEDLKESILRQRYGAIALAKKARRYGILVGMKIGQNRFELARKLHRMINEMDKKSWLIMVDYLSSGFLEGYYFLDCFVSTLCPRIAIDDYITYKTPIITPQELEIALGKKDWESYQFDQID